MLGWEILGLRSVLLVIFYPNNTRKSNSLLTIYYNRIGDLLIIVVLRIIIIEEKILILNQNLTPIILLLVTVRCFTKRAQFPLSRWLPAAIRAPTPISAIVHSSTLVTAGLFLLLIIEYHIIEIKIVLTLVRWIRRARFLAARIMAIMEADFKKVVAFSTMRQLRTIIIILSKNLREVAEKHIFFHAFFKTLLFCSAGYIFRQRWGRQLSKKINLKKGETILQACINVRILSIRGLVYTTSFYTKDLYLEKVLYDTRNILTTLTIFFVAAVTLSYSKNLLSSGKKRKKGVKREKLKKTLILLVFISTTLILEPIFRAMSTKVTLMPQITKSEATRIILIFLFALTIKDRKWKKKHLIISQNLIYIKEGTYLIIIWILKRKYFHNLSESDIINFKNYYILNKKLKTTVRNSLKKISYIVLFIILTLIIIKRIF